MSTAKVPSMWKPFQEQAAAAAAAPSGGRRCLASSSSDSPTDTVVAREHQEHDIYKVNAWPQLLPLLLLWVQMMLRPLQWLLLLLPRYLCLCVWFCGLCVVVRNQQTARRALARRPKQVAPTILSLNRASLVHPCSPNPYTFTTAGQWHHMGAWYCAGGGRWGSACQLACVAPWRDMLHYCVPPSPPSLRRTFSLLAKPLPMHHKFPRYATQAKIQERARATATATAFSSVFSFCQQRISSKEASVSSISAYHHSYLRASKHRLSHGRQLGRRRQGTYDETFQCMWLYEWMA